MSEQRVLEVNLPPLEEQRPPAYLGNEASEREGAAEVWCEREGAGWILSKGEGRER